MGPLVRLLSFPGWSEIGLSRRSFRQGAPGNLVSREGLQSFRHRQPASPFLVCSSARKALLSSYPGSQLGQGQETPAFSPLEIYCFMCVGREIEKDRPSTAGREAVYGAPGVYL